MARDLFKCMVYRNFIPHCRCQSSLVKCLETYENAEEGRGGGK